MRIRYAVVLCILMLNLTLGPRHASGLEGAGHALALEVVFRTDSDWSLLNFTGLGRILVGEHEVLAGGEASEIYVTFHEGHFTIFTGKKAYDTPPVEIRVRLVTLDPEEPLPLRIGKGHIGETGVTIMAWAGGDFKEVAAISHEGVNLLDPGAQVDRRGGATYDEYWDMAEEANVDWVLITSWNEWHEGTEIEPSLEHGFDALAQTRERAAGFKGIEPQVAVS